MRASRSAGESAQNGMKAGVLLEVLFSGLAVARASLDPVEPAIDPRKNLPG
jgi:hypothetical protein